jgi:hypothetical protein
MATHAIRHDKQAAVLICVGVVAVLIPLPDTPDVRAGGNSKMHYALTGYIRKVFII